VGPGSRPEDTSNDLKAKGHDGLHHHMMSGRGPGPPVNGGRRGSDVVGRVPVPPDKGRRVDHPGPRRRGTPKLIRLI